ncbi:MAG: hypothetical protein Q9185_005569 [Variospora sp. 1 TL-2023]
MLPARSSSRPGKGKADQGEVPEHPPPSAPKPQTGSRKKLACDKCRERKVRCNREQPVCGRCARLGHDCQYTTPPKQNSSRSDLLRLLFTLHSRLEQTEARLALNDPILDPNPGLGLDLTSNNVNLPSFDFMDMQQQQQPPPPQHPSSQIPSSQPVAQPDLGNFDNSSIDEQTLQADMDAW